MSAFRASRSVLSTASPHKYHFIEGKTPFWRKFREIFAVNPEISSGLPDPRQHRNPPPGSRPEKAAIPPSRAGDIAGNLYYDRDFRRKYPRLQMITQHDLTQLLLASPNEDGTKTLEAPGEGSSSTALARPEDLSSPSAFVQVLAQVHSQPGAATHYSASSLPPTPPSVIGKTPQHILKEVDQPPHAKHAYYPARNFA